MVQNRGYLKISPFSQKWEGKSLGQGERPLVEASELDRGLEAATAGPPGVVAEVAHGQSRLAGRQMAAENQGVDLLLVVVALQQPSGIGEGFRKAARLLSPSGQPCQAALMDGIELNTAVVSPLRG